MATTQQKKSGGQRTASTGGKRVASSSGAKTTKSSSSASSKPKTSTSSKGKSGSSGRKKTQPKKQPIRREVWAFVCLLLAVFSAFGYFNIKAIFIDLFCGALKGLLGYGYWVTPPALLLCAYILTFHRGHPVRLRVGFALLLPVMFSCIVHGLFCEPIPWDRTMIRSLWESGQQVVSGGALCGVMAQGSVQVFSKLGSTIIYGLALFLMGLGVFDLTVVDAADWLANRPHYEYEVKERPERPRKEKQPKEAVPAAKPSRRRAAIDIPMEEDEEELEPKADEPVLQKKKEKFFNRKSRVPAPDEILRAREERNETDGENAPVSEPVIQSGQSAVSQVFPEKTPAPEPEIDPVFDPSPVYDLGPVQPPLPVEEEPIFDLEPVYDPVAVPDMPRVSLSEPVQEMNPKVKKEEAAQAAVEVAQDIASSMAVDEHPYHYPPLSLLHEGSTDMGGEGLGELNANRQRLSDTIHSFGIDANIINVVRGPSVTRYELELDQGVRLNKLTNLSDDIALSLGASGVRIAPVPDRIAVVGIEVPNKVVSPVSIHSVIGSKNFTGSKSKVSFAVGKDISGECIIGDINKLTHLLIAGTTGSGKSVCTNSIISSLLYKATPEEVRLIMVDPKMVEMSVYNGIPHLLIPVVTDPKKAAGALQWAVTEMERRYRTLSEVGVRKLEEYNGLASKTDGMEKMPFIVILIDELADLMMVAAKEVEESICRIAQKGRAAGMHLVLATQRPSADVITGLMKANIPSRIAFAVASAMESRIILDTQGAEKLVGRGDMLYSPLGSGKPTRVQGCFISDSEVAAVVDFVKQHSGAANYSDEVIHDIEQRAAEKEKGGKGMGGKSAGGKVPEDVGEQYDELLDAATEVILETGQASVSMLQRRLKLGYARAARLVDQLEEKGIVGPFEGSKPRKILITKDQWQEMQYRQTMRDPGGYAAPRPAIPAEVPPFEPEVQLDRAEEDVL